MKKTIITLACSLLLACVVTTQTEAQSNASEPLTKKGQKILPQAGDIALGVDASPFLNYLGNMFSQAGNTAPTFNGLDQSITMKYFLTDKSAVRVQLSLNIANDITKGAVQNDWAAINNPLDIYATVVDVKSVRTNNANLYLGYEMRRGNGRLQGFYGGNIQLGFSSGSTTYNWANPMTANNPNPSSSAFAGMPPVPAANARVTEIKNARSFSYGLGGFVGVEYFFAQGMSLFGQVQLGLISETFSQAGQDLATWERFDNISGQVTKESARQQIVSGNINKFAINTVTTANIGLMFHF